MTTTNWLIALLLLAAVLAFALAHGRGTRRRHNDDAWKKTWRLAGAVSRSVGVAAVQRSAADLLASVRALSARGATWPEIMSAVNPTNDAQLGHKLALLRGPHQFVPHVALNVLEHGCEQALARNPLATQAEAIDAALLSAAVVVRAGD